MGWYVFKKHVGVGVVSVLLAVSAPAVQSIDQGALVHDGVVGSAGNAEISAKVQPEDRYPERHVDFPGGVTGSPDLVYSTLPGFRPLHLDLYRPTLGTSRPNSPLVVYVHGGGWSGGHTRQSGAFTRWPLVLASLASRGYVVASVEYRLSGEARFPAAVQDIKAAIRWLRANAERYRIDASRVLIWGASAGGQLAALVATSCNVSELEPPVAGAVDPQTPQRAADQSANVSSAGSDCVQAAVTWYGVFDFRTLAGQRSADSAVARNQPESADSRYLGCQISECPADVVASASPVTYVKRGDPPMLLIHGSADKTVPVQQTQEMYEKLRSAGVPAELFLIPDVDHSFIGKKPADTERASRAALARVFAFVDTKFARGGNK
jgi:acetyl esterase/lipase